MNVILSYGSAIALLVLIGSGTRVITCKCVRETKQNSARQAEVELDAFAYRRSSILGPITSGGHAIALDPPSNAEILRAIEKQAKGGERRRFRKVDPEKVRIVVEKQANHPDYTDAPRVYPLIGRAQLHHAFYKCTIYPEQATGSEMQDAKGDVVCIDHHHLHMGPAEE
jgi:hypothetical protein